MDRIIKEKLRIKHYTRYMDDCVLLHEDKEYLKHCLEEITRHIENDSLLKFNSKTQIIPISQGVDYRGFHFYISDTGKIIRRLRSVNKRRIGRRLKGFRRAYEKGKIDSPAIARSLASYKGHLSHGHTYKLRKNLNRKLVLHRRAEP